MRALSLTAYTWSQGAGIATWSQGAGIATCMVTGPNVGTHMLMALELLAFGDELDS